MQRAIKWMVSFLGAFSLLFGGFVVLHGTVPPASINTWLPAGNMTAARTGAAAVLLQDGSLLITGGSDTSVPLATTDIRDTSGNFVQGPPMNFARSNHVAVALLDGRVLVAGGTGADGRPTDTTEIFNPGANTWSMASPLLVPRSGATATLLPDGRVLIAGGVSSAGPTNTLEIYDPASGSFSAAAGVLSSARENHAATLLPDGRVLILGGWDGTNTQPQPPATTGNPNVLASTDIFDPTTGATAPGPALNVARMNFTATTAIDGSVVVIGGTDGQNDLASIEVLGPGAGAFALSGANLTTARQGHLAFLLPHNGNILVVGGSSSGAAISSAELYTPWTGATSVTGAMGSARSAAAGSPLFEMVLGNPVGLDGMLLVAGGQDAASSPSTLSSAEAYSFATVKTDAADYPPGSTVTITGSGWQPGETVTLSFLESPNIDTPTPQTAVADADGNIINTGFAPDQYDLGVRFYLTATGNVSQAQTTFTDATATNTTITSSQNPSPVNQSVTFTATVRNGSTQGSGTAVTVGTVSFGTGNNCAGGFSAFSDATDLALNSSGQASASNTFTTANAPGGITVRACYNGTSGTGTQDSADTLTQVVSAFGAVDHFLVVPSTTTPTAGTAFNVTVTAQDASNNTVTNYTGTVHFSLTNTDAAATLPANYTFTTGAGNDNGVHTFTNGVTLTVAGPQTINVNDTVTTTITGSANVTVGAGAANKLAFGQQPTDTQVGSTISPAVTVKVEDAYGNVITSGTGSTASITLAIGTNPSSGTLSGTKVKSAVSGIASFDDLKIDKAGDGYTLTASSTGLTGDTSSTFNITKIPTSTTVTVVGSPTQYSDTVTLKATVTPDNTNGGTLTGTINFKVGSIVLASGVSLATASGSGVTVAIKNPGLPAGTYTVTAYFTSTNINYADSSSTATNNLVVTTEGPNTTTYTGADTQSNSVTLTAEFAQPADGHLANFDNSNWDTTGDNLNNGGTHIYAQFYLNGVSVATVPLTNKAGSPGVGLATYSGTVPTGAYIVNVYIIETSEWFTHSAGSAGAWIVGHDSSSLLAGDISAGPTTTGGGWLPDAASTNGKDNFGFNVKWQKNGNKLQGNAVFLSRLASYPGCTGSVDIQVKTVQMVSMAQLGSSPPEVGLTGKANVQIMQSTDGTVCGGFGNGNQVNFSMTVVDGGKTGPDMYSMTILNPDSTVFKSIALTPIAGQIVVHLK